MASAWFPLNFVPFTLYPVRVARRFFLGFLEPPPERSEGAVPFFAKQWWAPHFIVNGPVAMIAYRRLSSRPGADLEVSGTVHGGHGEVRLGGGRRP